MNFTGRDQRQPTAASLSQVLFECADLDRPILLELQRQFPDIDLIRITAFGNTAVLSGRVQSLKERHLCVECCRKVPGISRVVDELFIGE